MIQIKWVFLFIVLFSGSALMADSTNISKSRLEILINVSNTLSRFTGNGTIQTVFEEPFLMGFKITNRSKKAALRIGINFNVSNITEESPGTSRVSDINSWAPLLGYEWRRKLGNRFEFYGGVDGRYYYYINRTRTSNINNFSIISSTEFRTTQNGFGFGPFCGFVFNLTPRVSLLTEGNFYLNFIKINRSFANDGSNFETFEDKYITSISPSAPSSLFLVVRF